MSRERSLWPREHGAYAQLGAPLVAALVIRPPTLVAGLLAAAAVLAFLANEPLLVLLGHRGARLRQTAGARAWRRTLGLGGAALVAGGVGLALADHATLAVVPVPALFAAVLIALAWEKLQHSVIGESVAAIALPAAAVPVAVASGLEVRAALLIWAAWSIGYVATVIAVHRVIARHRCARAAADVAAAAALIACALGCAALVAADPIAALALPLVALSAALVVRPPRATRLRAVGVALVIASVATLTLAPLCA
jgi:hypothetical protein